jgi:hypothetical protein
MTRSPAGPHRARAGHFAQWTPAWLRFGVNPPAHVG